MTVPYSKVQKLTLHFEVNVEKKKGHKWKLMPAISTEYQYQQFPNIFRRTDEIEDQQYKGNLFVPRRLPLRHRR